MSWKDLLKSKNEYLGQKVEISSEEKTQAALINDFNIIDNNFVITVSNWYIFSQEKSWQQDNKNKQQFIKVNLKNTNPLDLGRGTIEIVINNSRKAYLKKRPLLNLKEL